MSFTFSTCLEVNEDLVDRALAPVEDLLTPPPRIRILGLLGRMFQVAEPNQGAPRILLVLARLAGCDWLEGTLVVRLRASDSGTRIELIEDDGFSAERLAPAADINAPLAEFLRAVQNRPERIRPLFVESVDEHRLMLRAKRREIEQIEQVADPRLLTPELPSRAVARDQPTIEWSKPMRPRAPGTSAPAEPRRPASSASNIAPEAPLAPQRITEINATARMSAQQASEQVAKIRLKRNDGAQPAPPPAPASSPGPLPDIPEFTDDAELIPVLTDEPELAPALDDELQLIPVLDDAEDREMPPTAPRPALVAAAARQSRASLAPGLPSSPGSAPSQARPQAPPQAPPARPPSPVQSQPAQAETSSDMPTVIPPPEPAPTPLEAQVPPMGALPRVPQPPEPAPTPKTEIEVPAEAFLNDELDGGW